MKCRITNALLLSFLAAMFAPAAGLAQALALAPAQVVETFTPGVPFEIELSALNRGGMPVEMSAEITDLWYNEKNEKVFPAPGTSPRSAANWIQFVPEHFAVPANGSQKMKAIVTPPAEVEGGYYAVLFVTSKPQLAPNTPANSGKAIYTNMRIGCLVLLGVKNTERYKIELSDIKLIPPAANQPLEMSFTFDNQGNIHVFPVARLAVLDADRKLVAKAEGEATRFLPGQKDSMKVNWTGTLPAGDYTALLTVTYGEDRIQTEQVPFKVTGD